MRSLVSYLLILSCLAACGNKSDSPAIAKPKESGTGGFSVAMPTPVDVDRALEQILKNAKLVCATGACPEWVGENISWERLPDTEKQKNQSQTIECTGQLIAADLVMTNSHCIPKAVKDNYSLCSKYVGIKFPAIANHPEESFGCTKLII